MQVNAVGKELTEVERAYAAGFLDADGAIMATIEKHSEKKFGFRVRVVMKITQKDAFVLKWFVQTFQVGTIRKNRTTYDWITKDQTSVLIMIESLLPYLKVKRQQAETARVILNQKIYSKTDLLHCAHLADTLSRLNVRSKNRRKNYVTMIQVTSSPND